MAEITDIVFAKALYDFHGTRSDNLTFKQGDVLTVLKQDGSGWWQGSDMQGRIGLFPYVCLVTLTLLFFSLFHIFLFCGN
jgi:hypothetical protein